MSRRIGTLLLAALLGVCSPSAAQPQRLSIDARDIDLGDVIRLLAMQSGINLVPDGSIKPARVTLRLRDVTFDEALNTIAQAYGLQAHRDGRIIIIGDAAMMNRRYPDDALSTGTKTTVFPLSHAKPDELKSALADALPPGTVVVGDKRTSSLIVSGNATTIERARRIIAALDAPLAGNRGSMRSSAYHLRDIKASEAVAALKGSVPENVLVADDRQNVVLVTGNDDVQTTARTLLQSIDGPGRQVMFEVRVADLSPHIDSSNVGVQVGGTGFGSGALGQIPYLLLRSSLAINAQLNALVQTGHASILAQPRIATLNNKEATLLVGETYPVVTTNLQTGYPTVTNVDIGVKLRGNADDRRRRFDHGRASPRILADLRIQQFVPNCRQPQSRFYLARSRRRNDRARRLVLRYRLRYRDKTAVPGRHSRTRRRLSQSATCAHAR